jgi:F-type H+-transporting ATPase subunit b
VLPDLSVIWVVLAVLALAFALDRVLFAPLLRVMREREHAVTSAMELANRATAKAQAATAEFDATVNAARADLYKHMDERRKLAERYRAEMMARTRDEVNASLTSARSELDTQAAHARTQLELDSDALGKEIAHKVLGRA